jgi:hypothetical protein
MECEDVGFENVDCLVVWSRDNGNESSDSTKMAKIFPLS